MSTSSKRKSKSKKQNVYKKPETWIAIAVFVLLSINEKQRIKQEHIEEQEQERQELELIEEEERIKKEHYINAQKLKYKAFFEPKTINSRMSLPVRKYEHDAESYKYNLKLNKSVPTSTSAHTRRKASNYRHYIKEKNLMNPGTIRRPRRRVNEIIIPPYVPTSPNQNPTQPNSIHTPPTQPNLPPNSSHQNPLLPPNHLSYFHSRSPTDVDKNRHAPQSEPIRKYQHTAQSYKYRRPRSHLGIKIKYNNGISSVPTPKTKHRYNASKYQYRRNSKQKLKNPINLVTPEPYPTPPIVSLSTPERKKRTKKGISNSKSKSLCEQASNCIRKKEKK